MANLDDAFKPLAEKNTNNVKERKIEMKPHVPDIVPHKFAPRSNSQYEIPYVHTLGCCGICGRPVGEHHLVPHEYRDEKSLKLHPFDKERCAICNIMKYYHYLVREDINLI